MLPQPQVSLKIDPLTLADIPSAVAVEQAAYGTAPPQKDYRHELQQNPLAHYFALRASSSQPDVAADVLSVDQATKLIGVGGFWLIAAEINIITLAIQPAWKGLGLGEGLLLHLLEQGRQLGAKTATLEVRPSNHVAISLYKNYKFQEVGRRSNYYSDNHEDALIFTTPDLNLPDYQAMLTQRRAKLLQRLAGKDLEMSGLSGT
jgi:ribosomal-protein-alanine N-acetyltransferase